MSRAIRNLLTVSGAVVVAVVIAGLAQGGFEVALPELSQRMIGATNLSTYFVFSVLGLLFFGVGVLVPAWLRTPLPLPWLLVPVAALYVSVLIAYPGAYRCAPRLVAGCWVAHLPFWVAILAVTVGCLTRRSHSGARHVV